MTIHSAGRPACCRALLTVSAAAVALTLAAPAWAQDEVQAAAADGVGGGDGDIIVTGVRAAQIKAIGEKRAADNVVETLEANDVGKLPDQNVAEAVKRLPGLSVANDQGEGRYVIIRGIDPNLINVTLNGQTLPAPEPEGRQVKLDDLPSAMIQSITVTKSLLPNQDANAIGGAVDIRTKTAFDSKSPFFFDARGSVGWYDMNHKSPFEVDGTIGGRFGADEQFGAVVSVNYSRRPIESENFQGSEDYSNGGIPDGNGLRDYNLTRTRLGVVGNFDWHPTDGVKLYLRTSYSKFQDHETRDQNRLAVDDFTPGALTATGTILVRHREEDDNTKSATLGGEFDVAGGQLELSGGWTKAVKTDPIRSEFTFATRKGVTVPVNFDAGTDPYTLVPAGASAGLFDDPSQFVFSKYNFETRQAYEQVWQGRVDYTHPIGIGDDSSIAVGFKYLDRRKVNNQDKTDYKAGSTSWPLTNVAYAADPDFYGDMFHFGQRIDYFAARDFFDANPGVGKTDDEGTLGDTLSSDYDVREEIVAGYVMGTIKAGPLTVIPGVRIEHTRDRTSAKSVDENSTLDQGFNVFGRNSYTDVFPSINAKYELTRDLLLRGAVTTSIGRPNYADLAPFIVADTSEDPANISLGNPDLKPYKAVNFDASIEYYPAPDAVFSAGFFHKEIDNPIYVFNDRQTNLTLAGIAYPSADVSQPLNADKERVTGVEFNLQYQFSSLPGFFGGFGFSANYSHVWGNAKAPDIRSGKIPLMFQSKDVGNVALFYEKYGVTARLAFNYRSAYLDLLGGSREEDEYTDGNGQLDLHVGYQIMPQVTVFGDAINLTNAPWRRYIGTKDQLVEREQYGVQLRGGVQVHF